MTVSLHQEGMFCRKQLMTVALHQEGMFCPIKLVYPRVIEATAPCEESEQSCICVLGVSNLSLSTILIFYFGNDPTVMYFFLLWFPFYSTLSKETN